MVWETKELYVIEISEMGEVWKEEARRQW
ncbi:uncharacterized protein G2W53_013093 [Senna tora]|uniref:Uncharacterized protein n=1 Tax=Senna tora TaxID=362788 RepID=A0A834TY92_9FABA|nr:uncharacterized protein G2W53_013093 [Senna tora]